MLPYRRLDPSAEQARTWLRDVLNTPAYQHLDWLQRVLRWIAEHLSVASSRAGAPPLGASLVTAVVVVGLLLLVLPRIRRERRARDKRRRTVLDDARMSAAAYRSRAQAALQRQDFEAALLDFFRATARSAGDRTLLDDAPARTAHEVGAALAGPYPAQAEALATAAARFDAVCYGQQRASRAEAEAAGDLDTTLQRTRPRSDRAMVDVASVGR